MRILVLSCLDFVAFAEMIHGSPPAGNKRLVCNSCSHLYPENAHENDLSVRQVSAALFGPVYLCPFLYPYPYLQLTRLCQSHTFVDSYGVLSCLNVYLEASLTRERTVKLSINVSNMARPNSHKKATRSPWLPTHGRRVCCCLCYCPT